MIDERTLSAVEDAARAELIGTNVSDFVEAARREPVLPTDEHVCDVRHQHFGWRVWLLGCKPTLQQFGWSVVRTAGDTKLFGPLSEAPLMRGKECPYIEREQPGGHSIRSQRYNVLRLCIPKTHAHLAKSLSEIDRNRSPARGGAIRVARAGRDTDPDQFAN